MTEIDALGAYTHEETDEIKEQELWSLDATFTDYILPRIKAYRAMKRHGYPSALMAESVQIREPGVEGLSTKEEDRAVAEWENILYDIESAFQLLKYGEDYDRSKSQHEDITKGLGLFAKYYEHLWD